ncbi:TPA: hypothetical protein G9G10_001961 [Salmonella enterica subsp. houtenae serovar 43:z4,z32:-]|uniref:Uncharacterized protein n=1 Tax=Salmonella enterica subsp. houtenae serovar 45:g,z51:- TaxID=1967611 RepID=A0A753B0S9_SALHO|nr:hypothetical protein [Salmonella enterica]HAF0294596.1 hypothetical protein [Salmonella enterica subsp. houtenae serovar 43:z4,z32:-]AXD28281.1 hypothetical protein CHD54_06925 [Salmonella enterica]EAB6270843.1 hypothetical protein [Salmonella enterica subsp. houtenae]EAT1842282.1 hypothetical protein [Salmonella enterica]EAT7161315.1 hypothetical protein [Salmonella enterica]
MNNRPSSVTASSESPAVESIEEQAARLATVVILTLEGKVSTLTRALERAHSDYAKLKATAGYEISQLQQESASLRERLRQKKDAVSVSPFVTTTTKTAPFIKPESYSLGDNESLIKVRIVTPWVADDSGRETDAMLSAELIGCSKDVELIMPGIAIGIRAHSTDYPGRALPQLTAGDEITMIVRTTGTQRTKRKNIGFSGKGNGVYYILRPVGVSMANRPAPAVIVDVISREAM